MGGSILALFPGSPERAAVNIVSGSDTMPTVGPLRSLGGGPTSPFLPGKKLRKTTAGGGRKLEERTSQEAKRSRDDGGEKLSSLSWSATRRLKEQIRETAHPRTLTQPHSKSSRVPVAQRKPEAAKQTNTGARAAKLQLRTCSFYTHFQPSKKHTTTTKKHNHKKVYILESFARRVFHETTPVILKSYVIISK